MLANTLCCHGLLARAAKQFAQLRRREFITVIGGTAAWPLAARAQQPAWMGKIALLVGLPEGQPETTARITAFREGLVRLGWSEGGNIRIDYRYVPGAHPDQVRAIAKEVIALQPTVIVAQTPPVAAVMKEETQTIPIVFMSVGDPIGMGLIGSLARPGGNLTGLMTLRRASPASG
jgi:putative ABC transport system substrate-binding protein